LSDALFYVLHKPKIVCWPGSAEPAGSLQPCPGILAELSDQLTTENGECEGRKGMGKRRKGLYPRNKNAGLKVRIRVNLKLVLTVSPKGKGLHLLKA